MRTDSRSRRRARLGAPLAAIVALLAGSCAENGTDDPVAEEAPVLVGPENFYVAAIDTLRTGPALSGTLTPEREATVRAEVAGTVIQVAVEEGQRVSRGQLAGRIDDTAVKDALLSARSAERTAEEALMVAKRNAERAEKLAAAGAVSESDLEQARWSETNAEGGLADARARLASAEKQWANTQLTVPISGIVSERRVNPGDVVQTGDPLLTVVDPSSLRLEARLAVSALETIKLGTAVPFRVDGLGDRTFEGRITRINPTLDPVTRQVQVTVSLPNEGGRLVAGLFAQGRAAVETREGVVVPLSAIDRRGVRPTVTRLTNGAVERVEVSLGIEDQATDRVEITAGLAAGDTLIIGGARGMRPGTKVRPASPAEQTAGGTR